MRRLPGLILIITCLLTACSGGDETTSPVQGVAPVPPSPSTPPLPALLQNNYVQCGDWSQQLSGFTPPYNVTHHQRWVVMGSSSAFGAGASSYAQSWAGKLATYGDTEGIEVINIARGGYNTYQALGSECVVNAMRSQPDTEHNVDKALSYNPDLVIVSFPSNDAAMGYSAEESAYNLLLIRELLAREDVVTVIIGAQPRNMAVERQRVLVELDKLLKERVAACLVEVYSPLVDVAGNLSANYNAGDGVHINNAGHTIIYDRLLNTLTDPAAGCVQ